MTKPKFTKGQMDLENALNIHFAANLDRAIELSGRERFERTPCFVGSEKHIESLTRDVLSMPIVKAAPEMYEALEKIIDDNRLMNAMSKEQAKAIMYSLAKARGES